MGRGLHGEKSPCACDSRSPKGPHRLQYELTGTQNTSRHSQFVAKEYLYHRLIPCDNSENSRVETPGLLARVVLGAEPGDTVTSDFAEDRRDLWRKLADIRKKQRQNGGSHSLQEVRGCEIQEDTTIRAFRQFFYNGEPFLFYNEMTHEWEAPQSSVLPLAMEVKKSWDRDGNGNKISWAHVRGDLCGKMKRSQKNKTAVNGTCSRVSESVTYMTCSAPGFSPWNISLVQLQDDVPLSLDAQLPGGVLSYEKGTYCARVASRVPQGEEQRVTYSVEHSRNHTVTCGKEKVHHRPWPAVAAAVTVLVAAALLYNF
ncbi:MHC class I polypeptide-related sequence B-like isoform X2 [Talpa occidentalis]|uniref:MHC class I polypeptide-related sequence B-like isoform X2 n=1 Tax=Talpa occidentalis TaxID=50954 RepID=UPI00188FAD90|nr:MHC class I polypeptide-related sequence B-like isoform X2 [Talpa occidentalis]